MECNNYNFIRFESLDEINEYMSLDSSVIDVYGSSFFFKYAYMIRNMKRIL